MDGLVLKEIGLDKERMTIGRRPSNDIQIDNLAISGEHAVVVTILDDSFLEDLNSTNGTLVNGQPVGKHFLKDGDVVELGKYKLKYIVEAPPDYGELHVDSSTSAPEREAETASRPGDGLSPPLPAPGTAVGVIQVLNGANAGRELELSKSLTTLGKPGRQVAVITRRSRGYFITHVEGASFPTVNGRRLDTQAHPLEDHDVIEIAGIKMAFSLRK
ncbi:MAG: FHA domain-containing protein [Candidatus Accumulibacter sp.]|nr:FHA domain-containing protein [Accumulibacter sp.]